MMQLCCLTMFQTPAHFCCAAIAGFGIMLQAGHYQFHLVYTADRCQCVSNSSRMHTSEFTQLTWLTWCHQQEHRSFGCALQSKLANFGCSWMYRHQKRAWRTTKVLVATPAQSRALCAAYVSKNITRTDCCLAADCNLAIDRIHVSKIH